ncbi:MAG: hypothetical protein JWL84_699 [Rhodospirillales bacterium]|jgi:hypothetical protein|nr:hypothetical protein [Rhodospirillales bacterium]
MTGISEGMADAQALWRMWKAAESGADGGRAATALPDGLTLAAFAEGRLAGAEHAAVAAFLAKDADLAADVAAATTLAPVEDTDPDLARVIARAEALVAAPSDAIVPFRRPAAGGTSWRLAARWGSLAASLAVVSWLGFALGNDAYGSLTTLELRAVAPAGAADELLDPPAGFFEPGEASGT